MKAAFFVSVYHFMLCFCLLYVYVEKYSKTYVFLQLSAVFVIDFMNLLIKMIVKWEKVVKSGRKWHETSYR